ncbi:GntR family transcriptional regulator [Roseicyclus mahoneyensis]|uniref:GntR family transcriptional regulator n=1 Tax=Roseicyclus mahoneyensis TaxID=164332 RepID=A0A316GP02_9RHOB|nr:GntR family transcriptional regulator [Roseicyclus mahoneyensis]PWK62509.1 GntR family transcriptional regulator [Roseicyclus mahoneyensis]
MEMRHDIKESVARRRQRPLVLEVRDELERMILLGEIAAGERLNEALLAERLGVSRGPVREAARSLEREGLVEAVANEGVYVRLLAPQDGLELYDLRAMIAGYLCAALAGRADDAIKAELQAFLAAMETAIGTQDEAAYFDLNLAFHDRIAEAADMGRARALYVSLGKEVRLMRLKVLSGAAALRQSNDEHARIVAAIVAGDVEGARAAGAAHHTSGKRKLLERLRREGGACHAPAGHADHVPQEGQTVTTTTDLGRIT